MRNKISHVKVNSKDQLVSNLMFSHLSTVEFQYWSMWFLQFLQNFVIGLLLKILNFVC